VRSDDLWRVLIIEDDQAVADVHRQLVGRVAGFAVVGCVASAEDALRLINERRPHLLLLDLELRGAKGLLLLRRLRAAACNVEVIVVTASREADVVRSLAHLGALDYIVKPFAPERLLRALADFRRISALERRPLTQEEIDRVSHGGRLSRRLLPKGLSPDTLDLVRQALTCAHGGLTASQVALETGLARVTARRYLEYLVATHQASESCVAEGPGRPPKRYSLWA
jgi:response regulator of citrate/malate metabolism